MDRAVITVIGDVHGKWTSLDTEFLRNGEQDLVLFVGDLGDENVDIVRQISNIDVPKGVMLGNHDAWKSFSNKKPTSALKDSVAVLGDDHLAYSVRDIPQAKLSIIGARPFSWGGADIRSPEVYEHFYGVRSMEDSADAIVAAAKQAEFRDVIVFAHNGPKGLSETPDSIFGKDFGKRPGGDWGDRDLELALIDLRNRGFRIRGLIAGHMHHRLHPQIGGYRKRFVRREGEAYFNSAVVPRIRKTREGEELRHYLQTVWSNGRFESAEEIWVATSGEVRERFAVRFREMASR